MSRLPRPVRTLSPYPEREWVAGREAGANLPFQRKGRGFGFLLLFILLSACGLIFLYPLFNTSAGTASEKPPAAQALLATAVPTLTRGAPAFHGPLPTLTQTAVLSMANDRVMSETAAFEIPTPAPDPLRFVFPSPAPAPVSAWRPPLYPVPWALSPYDHFYFTRPIAADEVNWPLWDYRYGGSFFDNVIHTGVDIPAEKGTPVLAAGSGKVIWAGYGLYRGGEDPSDPYGLAVVIAHDFGYEGQSLYTVYGHLDRIDVMRGQWVRGGDTLGIVGETGKVTGPHLHFEVRMGDNNYFTTRNPELWMVPPQGWGVLAGRITDSAGQVKLGQDVTIHSLSSGQNWFAKTYGAEAVNSDSYYRENVVIGDLPSGRYEIRVPYAGFNYTMEIEILPGVVNYFSMHGHAGFSTSLPAGPGEEFTPPTLVSP